MTTILRAGALSSFTCLGDKCEDTCCKGWSMQVDETTLAKYKKDAPELVDAVVAAEESPWIMRKDEAGVCVKLEGGLCGIHKKYGADFLGDACYFYPRITRKLGEQTVMSATMSCPEIARLALYADNASAMEEAAAERLPSGLKNYLPEGMTGEDALLIHNAFLNAARDETANAEQIFLRVASASRSLERIDRASWPHMAQFYLEHADQRLPAAEINLPDPFNLLHALCGLIVATKKIPSPRLRQTVDDMEKALKVTLDWQNVQIHTNDESLSAWQRARARWKQEFAAPYAPILRRWLQMQLSLALYPFSGLGHTLTERVTILGVRLATIKLALMCSCSINAGCLPQDVVVRVVQSLSRLMDHLGDPVFSLQIYKETGWIEETRMRGVLEN